MTERLSLPVLGTLAFSVCLASRGATAHPEARRTTTDAPPPPGAVNLHRDLEILHLRAHAAADRLAEWDVGVYPLPRPFHARAKTLIPNAGIGATR